MVIEPNSVSISQSSLVFGNNVGDWLRKQNISKMIIVFDFKNKNIIFRRDDLWGLLIQYHDVWGDRLHVKTYRYFLEPPKKNRASLLFRARILNKDSIILENVPLNNFVLAIGKRIFIDLEQNLIIVGNFNANSNFDLRLTEKDLIRLTKPQTIFPTTNKQVTATPSAPISPVTTAPSEIKSETKHIYHKEIASDDLLEMPTENSTPTEEQIIIDKEYSKMILGE